MNYCANSPSCQVDELFLRFWFSIIVSDLCKRTLTTVLTKFTPAAPVLTNNFTEKRTHEFHSES